ncbi:MAG: hypothetical protein JRI23_31130 [Deltaproteobacteria bacterium]|jgi:hypothetical protein|nr:hypothetical protein [Deltaproteobacteria bacterium]MBW2536656.1 hypothetical protein [Deltaproteobacteria bacterium]
MTRWLTRMALFAAAACTAGCSGCGDDSEAPGVLTFIPAAGSEAPAVYLQSSGLEGGHLRLDVMGRGLSDVYGVAFRLEYDGTSLAPAEWTPAAFWPSDAISIGRQAEPGLFVVGLTHRGQVPGAPADDHALGTIDCTVTRPTPIRFVAGHGAVVDSDGLEASGVTWLGGEIDWR